ncbi:hypothetical protein MML48_7g00001404 [Holotrichia oblita]|uniref:Uncharacterized protein n=1 Tax=Holotrichia oblita TaxID=644536 RepID=A0ACB9SU36_HOLOL|nr:hypothetical protein MML48_7g00001404 [Holotrichia oblita]
MFAKIYLRYNPYTHVCTSPPSNHLLSDGDRDQENALVRDLDHLTGNQLRAEAELQCVRKSGSRLHSEVIGLGDSNDDNLPLSKIASSSTARKQIKKKVVEKRHWKGIDLPGHQRRECNGPEFLDSNRYPVE